MGKTWKYQASEFPAIDGGQRLVLMRLNEGPLLLVSFTDHPQRTRKEDRGMEFTDAKGYKFKGWLVNGKPIGETWSVLSETTVEITADFEVKNFDVTLDVNGGDELNNNVINVIYGEEYLLPEPTFEGKDFICWTVKGGEPISIQGVWLFDDVVELVAVCKELTLECS
jgi:hypothetical protein